MKFRSNTLLFLLIAWLLSGPALLVQAQQKGLQIRTIAQDNALSSVHLLLGPDKWQEVTLKKFVFSDYVPLTRTEKIYIYKEPYPPNTPIEDRPEPAASLQVPALSNKLLLCFCRKAEKDQSPNQSPDEQQGVQDPFPYDVSAIGENKFPGGSIIFFNTTSFDIGGHLSDDGGFFNMPPGGRWILIPPTTEDGSTYGVRIGFTRNKEFKNVLVDEMESPDRRPPHRFF